MKLYLLLLPLMLFLSSGTLLCTVRTSANSGPWNSVAWNPSGPPEQGDTIVITTQVWNIPTGSRYGKVIIWDGGVLIHSGGVVEIGTLVNGGILTLRPGAVCRVDGDLINNGTITDAGAIEMIRAGSHIVGTGSIAHLILNTGAGSLVWTDNNLALESLDVLSGGLHIEMNDLTVNGRYTSSAPFTSVGITTASGLVRLNGPVSGTVRGSVRFGWVTGEGTSRYPKPPSTYGRFGGAGDTVEFVQSRRIGFSELLGTVIVDSGATVTGEGIGAGGGNTVLGTVINKGTITAVDERFIWKAEGDVVNRGSVDRCSVLMTGHVADLWNDPGAWGNDAALTYRSHSGGWLQLHGSMTLPRLRIEGTSETDTGISVHAGNNEVIIRHSLSTDIEHHCRLITDSLVRLRNDASGIVRGNVAFEGFFDSKIEGVFGGAGNVVAVTMPTTINGAVAIEGHLSQRPGARLRIGPSGRLEVPGGTVFEGTVSVDSGGDVIAVGDLGIRRGMKGGGRLIFVGALPSFDMQGGIHDSISIEIGSDAVPSVLTVLRSFVAPSMTIHPGSMLVYSAPISVGVAGTVRYRIAVPAGYSMLSAAVRPSQSIPSAVFPGADSVFAFDDSLGYVAADSVVAGRGYWVHFPDNAVIEQVGSYMNPPLATDLSDGWNLLGGAGVPVDTADIVYLLSEPQTPYFEFMTVDPPEGYCPSSVLLPGRAYLIRVDGDGILVRR